MVVFDRGPPSYPQNEFVILGPCTAPRRRVSSRARGETSKIVRARLPRSNTHLRAVCAEVFLVCLRSGPGLARAGKALAACKTLGVARERRCSDQVTQSLIVTTLDPALGLVIDSS